MRNLSELLKRLLNSEIEFVLVGGFASVIHGATLVTQDLDICALMNPEQMTKLRELLHDLNPRHRMNPAIAPSFLDQPKDFSLTKNLYLKTDLGVLDVMSELPPIGDFHSLKARAVKFQIYGHDCYVISLDDLIAIKETMNRPKDLHALDELKRLKALKS